MRIANIMIVYKDPELIERIIRSMEHENFDFYIHVDKKVNDMPFRNALRDIRGVHFIQNRIVVRWASFSFVSALVNCIGEIINTGQEYDFVNHISGQDYPIKTAAYIYNFFDNHPGKSFLSSEKYPSAWWKHAESRFTEYHMTDYDFRGRHRLGEIATFLLPKRKFPLPYTLYGGPCASYWALSIGAAKYLFDFINGNKKLRRFFKYTWAPDEYLVNTVIMNSPFKDNVINDNYRYMDWSSGGPRPKVLTVKDFPAISKSDKLFARKFDRQIDVKILDLIDNEILVQ